MPRKKSQSQLWSTLPTQVFISHAYADEASKSKLLQDLQERAKHVLPQDFPRRDPDPHYAVSDEIVPKIRSCGGLIYLDNERSKRSLWVNFERDYAHRSGLKVFAFDAQAGILREDSTQPVALNCTLVVGDDPEHRADELIKWMKHERSFDFEERPTYVRMKEISLLVAEIIAEGRCVLWFLDNYVAAVAEMALELDPEDVWAAYYDPDDSSGHSLSDFESYAGWLNKHSMYVRFKPEWHPKSSEDPDIEEFIRSTYAIENDFHGGWAVDLVSHSGEGTIDWNRADDLIVRTTLMTQQLQPFFIDLE